MLPYQTWMNQGGDWFFEVFDHQHGQWMNHGPFETEEQAEEAAVRFFQHE